MAHVGRFIRREMAQNARAAQPDAVAGRLADQEAGRLTGLELDARYPRLTADNAQEAMAWQAERRLGLTAELLADDPAGLALFLNAYPRFRR